MKHSQYEKAAAVIDGGQNEMKEILRRLVKIPSVRKDGTAEMPYGPAVAEVLAEGKKIAEELGFSAETVENRWTAVDFQDPADTALAILGHLDVVPTEGQVWKYPQFDLTEEGDFLYGRGALDNKGPTVAALYAMAAIRAAGIPLKRNVRLFLGGDEECGGSDVVRYKEVCGLPENVIVPDSSFPAGISERGMIRLSSVIPTGDTAVRTIKAGAKINVIPAVAEAELVGIGREALEKACAACPAETEIAENAAGLHLTVKGRGGHAAHPGSSCNALTALLEVLAALEPENPCWRALKTAFPHGVIDGSGLFGRPTGNTLSLTMMTAENGEAVIGADCRTALNSSAASLLAEMRERFPYPLECPRLEEPHVVSPDAPIVSLLQSVYFDHTGRNDPPYAMGARTYSQKTEHGVIFGGRLSKDGSGGAHAADEHYVFSTMVAASRMYADLILRICG